MCRRAEWRDAELDRKEPLQDRDCRRTTGPRLRARQAIQQEVAQRCWTSPPPPKRVCGARASPRRPCAFRCAGTADEAAVGTMARWRRREARNPSNSPSRASCGGSRISSTRSPRIRFACSPSRVSIRYCPIAPWITCGCGACAPTTVGLAPAPLRLSAEQNRIDRSYVEG